MNLKRFKGAGEFETDAQNCEDSRKPPVDGMGIWAADGAEKANKAIKNGSPPEATSPQGRVSSPNASLQTNQPNTTPRSLAHVKENGRSLPVQGAADSSTPVTPTPTPPPLKPAPSAFSAASFPSLGQMPILVPGAPAPKASPSQQAEQEDACQTAYSKSAALVSPGPVTISWSQDSVPSVALSSSVGFNPKATAWGALNEVRTSSTSVIKNS